MLSFDELMQICEAFHSTRAPTATVLPGLVEKYGAEGVEAARCFLVQRMMADIRERQAHLLRADRIQELRKRLLNSGLPDPEEQAIETREYAVIPRGADRKFLLLAPSGQFYTSGETSWQNDGSVLISGLLGEVKFSHLIAADDYYLICRDGTQAVFEEHEIVHYDPCQERLLFENRSDGLRLEIFPAEPSDQSETKNSGHGFP